MQVLAVRQYHGNGAVGVGNETVGRMAQRDKIAAHRRAQQVARIGKALVAQACEQRDRYPGQLDQRLGQADIARRLGNADEVSQAKPHAARRFRREHAEQAHFADRPPALLVDRTSVLEHRAQAGGRAGFEQHFARGFVDRQLVFGEGKFHGPTLSAGQACARR